MERGYAFVGEKYMEQQPCTRHWLPEPNLHAVLVEMAFVCLPAIWKESPFAVSQAEVGGTHRKYHCAVYAMHIHSHFVGVHFEYEVHFEWDIFHKLHPNWVGI